MASPFDDLDAVLSSAILTAYGEAAVLQPRVASQYVERTANEARDAVSVWGVFSAGPAEASLKGQAVGGEYVGTTRFQSARSEFWISKAQADALDYRPQKGDTLSFPGRPEAPIFSIAAVQPTDMGDLAFILVREDQDQ